MKAKAAEKCWPFFFLVQNQDFSGEIIFLTSQEVKILTFQNFTGVRFGPFSNLAGVSFRVFSNLAGVRFEGFSISTEVRFWGQKNPTDVRKKFGRRRRPKIFGFFGAKSRFQ